MAVKIRLMRMGKRKQPSYRIVVADSRSPRDGRNIETIGHYGPLQDPSQVDVDGEKALAWLRNGAQPTEQVQKLLAITGVWAQFEAEKRGPVHTKLNRRRLGEPKVEAKKAKREAPEAGADEDTGAPAASAEASAGEPAEASSDDVAAESSEESGDE